MTPETFDDAARGLASGASRRAAVTALLSVVLAMLRPGEGLARPVRKSRRRKRKNRKNGGRNTRKNKDKNRKRKKGKKSKKKKSNKRCKVKHSEKQILRFIAKAAKKYGQSRSAMERVARCESGLDPCAYNKSGPYYGLFQFLKSTWKTTPYKKKSIHDPKAQAMATAWMWKKGRKNEWACK